MEEFVIESSKIQFVKDAVERIRLLFSVNVILQCVSNSEVQWIQLNGGTETDRQNAKDYIMSVCNGLTESVISLSSSDIYNKLAREEEHFSLERLSCAVIEFRSDKLQVVVRGSELAVAVASSKIDEEVCRLQSKGTVRAVAGDRTERAGEVLANDSNASKTKNHTGVLENASLIAAERKSIRPDESEMKLDPALKEFAMKLNYTEEEIHLVVRKFGPNVTQDKLLHELIRYSAGKKIGRTTAPELDSTQPWRHSPSAVVARGAPSVQRVKSELSRDHWEAEPQGVSYPDKQVKSDDFYAEPTVLVEGVEDNSDPLRPIVIDGSNVAMHHGNQRYFSCRGILLCVEYFKKRGHTDITAFVPRWRMEATSSENPIADQEILHHLEREKHLGWTPSRRGQNGRRIVCYDDRFILELANKKNGIVVSNDNFRDLLKESQWKDIIEQRLLMYSFVGDIFMVPDDPLGRHGPPLEDFLRKGTATHPKICPFLKNCTFGPRCRYYHPERDPNRKVTSRGTTTKDTEPEYKVRVNDSENLRCRPIADHIPTSRTILVADSSSHLSPTYQSQIPRDRTSDLVRRGPVSTPLPSQRNQLSPDEYYPEGPHHQYTQTLPRYRDEFVPVNTNSAAQYYRYEHVHPGQNSVYYPGGYPNMPTYYPPQQWSGYYVCAPPVYTDLYRPCDEETTDAPNDSLFNKLKEVFPGKEHEQIIRDVMKNYPEKCVNKNTDDLVHIILSNMGSE